jgi:SAM-dependent methyltransferase
MQILFDGVEAITVGAARALADAFDFSQHHRLLDLGGGTGSFVCHCATRHPHLRGTLFDLAPGIARERLLHVGLAERFAVVEGDFFADPIPEGHDVVLLSSIVHYYQPAPNLALLRRAREASAAGTRLLLVDFWLDATRTTPLFNALMAGEFLVVDGGDAYSVEQVRGWLAETGWRYDSQLDLGGPASVILATAADEGP